MSDYIIYTDGACSGNPGPGGWGVLIMHAKASSKKPVTLSGGNPKTTNNRMEMQAVISALEYLKEHGQAGKNVAIHSDSKLVISTMTSNWKRKQNLDLWKTLDHVAGSFIISWVKVKGHSSDRYNQKVDQLAVKESLKFSKPAGVSPVRNESTHTFVCERCGHATAGKLTWKESNQSIRVDCLHCGRFIKFAPKTKELERMAKKAI